MQCIGSDNFLSPGIASNHGRAAAEGCVPVIRACKRGVKAAALTLLCAAIGVLCFATACQPTPAEDVVVNKNEGAFENAIAATPTASQAIPYQAPAHLQYKMEGLPENLQIVFDADVEIPALAAYPVLELEPYRLTQADADNILNALLGGNALYEQTEQRSRAEIQQSIDYYQRELQLCEPEHAELIAAYQAILNELFQEYEAAEEQPSYALASRELKFRKDLSRLTSYLMSYGIEIKSEDGQSFRYEWTEEALAKAERDGNEGIRGVCFLESGRKMQVEVYNGPYESADAYNASYVAVQLAEGNLMQNTRLSMTREQAVERAQALLAQMKLDFVPVLVSKQAWNGTEQPDAGAYMIAFKRDIPGTAANAVVGAQMEENRYMPLMPPETLTLLLDDYGLLGFHWNNPRMLADTIQENAALLPFDQIQARIEQQLKVQNLWEGQFGEDSEHPVARRLEIDKITLSYMQLPKKDDASAFYYAPVWDVCGDLYVRFPDGYTPGEGGGYLVDENNERELLHQWTEEGRMWDVSVLTINAIDGSVGERFQGS